MAMVPFSEILDKLRFSIMKELTAKGKLELQLKELEKTVETIKVVLLDSEMKMEREMEDNEAIKKWLCELKDICYDVDDLLDEIVIAFQMKKRDLENGNTGALKKVRLFLSNKFGLGFSASVRVRKILDIMNFKLQDAVQFRQFNNLGGGGVGEVCLNPKTKKKQVVFVEKLGLELDSVVVGRDSDKESVINMLLPNKNNPDSVVAIVGMGGVGKTTLAKYVYLDDKINQEFQLMIWVTVSTQFDATSVLAQISRSATATTNGGGTTVDVDFDVERLSHLLGTKKYLLVLDDVWTESAQDWHPLRDLLPTPTPNGSKCLVTTRSVVAARTVGDGPIYNLQPLSAAHSWDLFKRIAFAQGKEEGTDPRLVDIGKQVVSKCAGLPLAIRTIASLLYGHGVSKWFSFKNAVFADTTSHFDDIFSMLKLSYDRLSYQLKLCFLYCSLFPKGYRMDKEFLIQLWIAQGYISPANDRCLEDAGEAYFTELLHRSFFQHFETDSRGGIMFFEMHDLLHDLAVSLAKNEILVATPSLSTFSDQTHHLSVVGVKDNAFPSTWLPGLKKIRTYLDFSLPTKLQQPITSSSFLSGARRLRVLDAHNLNISSLPEAIGQLLHLRYLDISGNSQLEVLPGSITQLYCLQTLKLSGCSSLKELPCDFGKLVNLRCLDIHGCNKVSHMPLGFSTLTCLHTLTMFVVGQESYASVPDQLEVLKSLSNLNGSLTIKLQTGSSFDAIKTRDAEYLKSMINLKALSIQWGKSETLHKSCSDHDALLESLKPHFNLRSLKVVGFPGVTLPSWAASSANLLNICLDDCPNLHHLPRLSRLPHLKGLLLHKLGSLEYMESDCYVTSDPRSRTAETTTFFPSLENLTLSYLPKLKGWWSVVGRGQEVEPYYHLEDGSFDGLSQPSFPRLGQLKIMECPKLVSIPPCPQVEELSLYRFNEALQLILSTNLRQQQHSLQRRVTVDNVGYINRLPLECHQDISDISVHLSNLETLSLGKEVFSGSMCSLQSLQVTLCSRLKSLSGLGWKHLPSLQRLQLSNLPLLDLTAKADDVEEDVMPWESLHSLQILELDFLPKLFDLPDLIQSFTELKTLEIRSCHNLKALPEWISCLASLQSLRLEACTALTCLPDSIMHLTSLENLEVLRCSVRLREKCQNSTGEDWPKIMHIPHISIF